MNKKQAENILNLYRQIMNEGRELNPEEMAEWKEAQDYIVAFTLKKSDRKRTARRWKRDEDRVNERLGMKREGHLMRGLPVPDGSNDMFCQGTTNKLALKVLRKEFAKLKGQTTKGRISILVTVFKDEPIGKAMVHLELDSWADLHGN